MNTILLLVGLLVILTKLSIQQTTTDCDVDYKCFRSPANCVNTACTYIYKWRNNGNTLTDFVIAANVGTTTSKWFAIGFSTDTNMGGDDVVMCKSTNAVEHYRNSGQTTPTLLNSADPYVGLTNRVVAASGTWLICSFTRQLSLSTQTNYFDLNTQYYILAAYGPLGSSAVPNYHTTRTLSSSLQNFRFAPVTTSVATTTTTTTTTTATTRATTPSTTASTTTTTTTATTRATTPSTTASTTTTTTKSTTTVSTTTTKPATTITATASQQNALSTADCDVTYRCFLVPTGCQNTACTHIYKWKSNGNTLTDFIISANVGTPTNKWLAIGFSTDDQMGNDGVVMCKSTNSIEHYQNTGKVAPTILNSNDRFIGLTNRVVTISGQWLTCSFTRQVSLSTQANYFDFNNNYYVLAANGDISSNGDLNYHTTRQPSSMAYSFKFPDTTVSGQTTTQTAATTTAKSTTTVLTTTKAATTITGITTAAQQNALSTADCDVTYRCFLVPTGCQNTACTHIYKWKSNGNTLTDFIISANVNTPTNKWVAIGFSSDDQMGNDGVVMCKSTNLIEHYQNTGKVAPTLLNSNDRFIGLTNRVVTISGQWLSCSFTRQVSLSTQVNYFDLNNNYYVLAANGDISSNGDLNYHTTRQPSSMAYSFKFPDTTVSGQTTTQTAATTTVASASIDSSDCAKTKGCFLSPSNCQGSSCRFIFKYASNADSTSFELYGNVGSISNPWLAIGFSTDTTMGNDGVCLCASSGEVEHRYNSGRSAPGLVVPSNPTIGISNVVVSLQSGWLRCKFSRIKSNSSISNYFDLTKEFFVLAAYGSVSTARAISGTLNFHVEKTVSSSRIDFNSFSIAAEIDYLPRIKSHACLMVIAWMFFASVGIIFARYYKFILPNVNLCKLQFWFIMHRPLMMCVPIISIAGFLVILSSLEWKWVEIESSIMFSHSILGILAICFAIIQPFIALCRCDKDSPNRYLFNFFHRLIGLSAFLFAIVAIFLGTQTDDLELGDNGWGIVLGWSIWLVILVLSLEFIQMRYARKPDIVEENNTNDPPQFDSIEEPNTVRKKQKKKVQKNRMSGEGIKEFLLLCHIIITIGFTTALVVIIGISK